VNGLFQKKNLYKKKPEIQEKTSKKALLKKKAQIIVLMLPIIYTFDSIIFPMAKYTIPKGYDPTECNEFKRQRKNITNKIYRRNEKLRQNVGNEQVREQTLRELVELERQRDLLNGEVWKCSQQFFSLKKKKESIRSKIQYRKNQSEKFKTSDPKKSSEYNRQVRSLKDELEEVDRTLFYGSPRYENMNTNFQKLGERIVQLQNYLKRTHKKFHAGEIDERMFERQRQTIIDEIKALADERKALEETISGERIIYMDHDRVEFDYDPKTDTTYAEYTIFWYADELRSLLDTNEFKTVVFKTPDYTQTFNYPNDVISIENAIIELDQKYAQDGSDLDVSIYTENSINRITISVNYRQSITEQI